MEAVFRQRNPIALVGAVLAAALAAVLATLQPLARPATAPAVMHISLAALPEAQPAAPPQPASQPLHPRLPTPQAPTNAEPSPAPVATTPLAPASPAAPPVTQVAPAPPSSEAIEAAYSAVVRQEIERQKIYPTSRDARIQHPSGRVTVWFVLARDGAINDVGIEESAGSILDHQAAVTVRLGRYAPFPEEAWKGQAQRRFTVELDFFPT